MRDYIEYLENKPLKHLVMDDHGKIGIDYADKLKDASYYVGSWLVAKVPVKIYSSAGGTTVIANVNTGGNVGRIYSYVMKPDGSLYWQLEGVSGNGTGGFVKHVPGAFSNQIALDTASGKEHEELITELEKEPIGDAAKAIATGATDIVKGAGKTLSVLGDNLIWIILAAIAGVLLLSYTKFKTA